jgi:tetratricopeptide (TPR) repeat protein
MRNQKSETGNQNQIRIQNDRMGRSSPARRDLATCSHWDLIRHSGFGFLIFAALLAACTGNAQSRQYLDSGKKSLDSGNYDQSIRDADAVIASGDGPALAEAYYLRGYTIQMRPKADYAAQARDWAMARDSYTRALANNPRPTVAARLHAQLGLVSFDQRDYAAAVPELQTAYGMLDASQPKDLILYRIGVGQQRLGRFADADTTFQRLLQDYPNSSYASLAKAHQGVRGFYVQVGAYSKESDIEAAARAIAVSGTAPMKTSSNNGLTIIRTADVPSYAQADQLRQRLAGQYPDARVMP